MILLPRLAAGVGAPQAGFSSSGDQSIPVQLTSRAWLK
jgi:hypothetical protein